MTLLSQYDPPAHLDDLDCIPDGRSQWHNYIGTLVHGAVGGLTARNPTGADGARVPPRFYDAHLTDPGGDTVTVPILWNAFPRRLLSRFGRDKAMVLADMLWPAGTLSDAFDPLAPGWQARMAGATEWKRPQDEYCEWRVERDPHGICSVVFTTESPEYWTALHGGNLSTVGQGIFRFDGKPQVAADLYTRLLETPLKPADLQRANGDYNPLNAWNTVHGIVHLTHGDNELQPEVMLCADASLAYQHANGGLIAHPEAVCCAITGAQVNRHSDPTIVGTLNALARRGAWLTLANPVGLCIDHVDTKGWELPGLADPQLLLRTVRGGPGHILRMEVRVPHGSKARLSQLTIAGEPLRHGGQIAECITVKAVATCVLPHKDQSPAIVAPQALGYLLDSSRHLLKVPLFTQDLEPGWTPAFRNHPGVSP